MSFSYEDKPSDAFSFVVCAHPDKFRFGNASKTELTPRVYLCPSSLPPSLPLMILMLLGQGVGIFLLGVQVLGRLGIQQIHTLNLTQKHALNAKLTNCQNIPFVHFVLCSIHPPTYPHPDPNTSEWPVWDSIGFRRVGCVADLSSLNADAVTHCGTWGCYLTSEPCVLVVITVPLS